MNIPYKLGKFLFNITTEALAGRLEKKDGSFDWNNEKGWELPIMEWEPLVPTHGNFAGPGYSCGRRGEFSPDEIKKYAVARVFDPKLGEMRNDYVDILAKEHDLAYAEAKGKPDYWQRIREADMKLVGETQKLLYGTSPLFSDGGKMTPGEKSYAESMLDGFKIKLVMMDELPAALQQFKNSGYGRKEINDLYNTLSQGLKFLNPRDLLRKLNFSENEMQEIEQKYAAYSEQDRSDSENTQKAEPASTPQTDNIQTASASYEYTDEDYGNYYGPGMG